MREDAWWGNGWDFAPPKGGDGQYTWTNEGVRETFEDLFSYAWLKALRLADGTAPASPVFARETIEADGAWAQDFMLLDPLIADHPLRGQLQRGNYTGISAVLADAPDTLWINFEGVGAPRENEVTTVELLNPLTYQRERMGEVAFCKLGYQLENATRAARWAKAKRQEQARLSWQPSLGSLPTQTSRSHTAASMLLVNLFAAKQVPFPDVANLTTELNYTEAYACLTECDDPAAVGWRRLALLYR